MKLINYLNAQLNRFFIALLVLLLMSNHTDAQRETDNWIFGASDNWVIISDTGAVGYSPPINTPWSNEIIFTMRSASISDSDGNLIAYTDGSCIYNNQYTQVLYNYSESFIYGPKLIIPMYDKPSDYWLLRQPLGGSIGWAERFRYNQLDSSFSTLSVSVSYQIFTVPKFSATYHADGKQIWTLIHENNNDRFDAVLLGIDGYQSGNPVTTNIGSTQLDTFGLDLYNQPSYGHMKFSPGGNFVAMSSTGLDIIEIYDFDNETGVLSNRREIGMDRLHSFEFSSNGTVFYFSQLYACHAPGCSYPSVDSIPVYQVDLLAGNDSMINASIYEASGPSLYTGLTNGNLMQLASNQNIYVNVDAEGIAVIENPNLPGPACNWIDTGVVWPVGYAGWGMQNLPEIFVGYLDYNIVFENHAHCVGDTSMFYTLTNQGFDSIRWQYIDPLIGQFSIPNQDSIIHYFAEPGEYEITLKRYRNGNQDEIKKRQYVYPNVNIDLPEDTIICEGIDSYLTASEPFCDFIWVNHYTPDGQYYPTDTTYNDTAMINAPEYWWPVLTNHSDYCGIIDSTYVIVQSEPDMLPSDTAGICINTPLTLDATTDSVSLYQWSTGDTTNTISAFGSGTYTVTIQQGQCTFTDSMHIDYEENLNVNIDSMALRCDGDTLLVYAGDFPADYLWSPGGETGNTIEISTPGIYSIALTNSCGVFSDTIQVLGCIYRTK